MTAVALESAGSAHARAQPPFALMLGLAWLAAMVQLLSTGWAASGVTLPDADDAMRLVEWKAWLAGQGWYDLHVARLAPPVGYDSHWSRLIDAGLAGLFLMLRPFAGEALAERLTLVLWPMLWLLPAIGGVAAIAWRIGGREAAMIALLLAAFSLPAFQQFRPGRIDHHNLHLALSVLTVAAACWPDRWRPAPVAAGLLTGLALAIGFESLPFVMVAGAGFALRFAVDPAAGRPLAEYGIATALAVAAAFLVSVGPAHWPNVVCDAIAVNSAAAAIVGALGLSAAGMLAAQRGPAVRLAAVALAGAAALAVFAAFEPRCLAGPFGLVDPAIGPVWIDHVAEVQPLARMMHESLATGLMAIAFPALALLAMSALLSRRKDFGALIAGAAFLLAFAMTLAMVKAFSYAAWFGLPLVAAGATVVFTRLRWGLVPRAFVALALTPTAVTLGAMAIGSAIGSPPLALDTTERQACVRKDNVAALAALPTGLMVANELEWGPYLLAWTPHAVFAAPYHRLSTTIVTAHAMLARPPQEARRILADNRIDYIVTCGSRGPLGLDDATRAASLWGRLQAHEIPDWLTPVALPAGQPFTVYRVAR